MCSWFINAGGRGQTGNGNSTTSQASLVSQTVKNPPALPAGQDDCSPILVTLDPAPRGGRVLGAGALRGRPPGVADVQAGLMSRRGCDGP